MPDRMQQQHPYPTPATGVAASRREAIESLWQACFHDSETFVRLYFDSKYREEDSLLHTEGGKALAAFLMPAYPLQWEGRRFPASYISGACTLPEARNRGIMTRLLQEGFHKMHARGRVLSTLIPAEAWLFGYYARLGYAPVFLRETAVWQGDRLPGRGERTETEVKMEPEVELHERFSHGVATESYPYFLRSMEKHPCHIVHDGEDYRAILADLFLGGGCLALARRRDGSATICGMALAVPEEGKVVAKELVSDGMPERNALLKALAAKWQLPTVEYRTFDRHDAARPYGMARLVRPLPLLAHFAARHPGTEAAFMLEDPLLPENSGIYTLAQGQCRFTHGIRTASVPRCDVAALTRRLLTCGGNQPYMNLMLD